MTELLRAVILLWCVSFLTPAVVAQAVTDGAQASDIPADPFLDAVDLTPFHAIAVHTGGRLKSYESFVRGLMTAVTGAKEINGQPLSKTYFDLMLRPERYTDVDYIQVKMKLMRADIADALMASVERDLGPAVDATSDGVMPDSRAARLAAIRDRLDRFQETGLISPAMLQDPSVVALMRRFSADLVRTATKVEQVETALGLSQPDVLRAQFVVIPPDAFDQRWMTFDDLRRRDASEPLTEGEQRALEAWDAFSTGWMNSDAQQVNEAAATLATILPTLNTELYPEESRLAGESWYFNAPAWAGGRNMVGVWVYYGLAMVPLLLSVVFRWRGAYWFGMFLFVGAFGFHTAAVLLRWYVAQRWPNTNMFEAVTTAAWFGGCFAILLEPFVARSSLRGLVALGSAAASGVAMMAAKFMPTYLDPNISNRMPVLHDVWLYIHTNVIIFSYCLIFMASVSALLYVVYRGVQKLAGQSNGHMQYARVGGAGSLVVASPDGGTLLKSDRTSLGQVLDGTTMILMELSFVLLWAGIVMGAIWADHSWGRPWGWDPKEVFALNTFIIFAILIHVRLRVKDKGIWTALLAIVGCVVMLFNWIVINFTIAGLHSYAGG